MRKTFQMTKDFFKNTFNYFGPVIFFHLLLLLVVVPTLTVTTNFLLRRKEIDYLAYDNVISIFSKHPLTALALVGILVLTLVAVFLEFTFLTILVHFVRKKEKVTIPELLYATFSRLRHLRPSLILFFLFYFMLVLPLSGFASGIDIISAIQVPNFILEFIATNNWWLLAAYILLTVLSIFIGYRLIFVLPLMILQQKKLRTSLSTSWQMSKGTFKVFFFRFTAIFVSLLASFWVISQLLILLQSAIDYHMPQIALASATVIMFIIQVSALLHMLLSLILIFYVVINLLEELTSEEIHVELKAFRLLPKAWRWVSRSLLGIFTALFIALIGIFNVYYLSQDTLSDPLIISHRGVSEKNGVQNTIPALIETSQTYRPDYVEMDVRETKDKQFVVMHDENLRHLAGVNKRVNELTLAELTKLTVRENGKSAPLPSFDEYLKEADKLHQKLLIEIKIPLNDDVEAVSKNFLQRYKKDIEAKKHQVQSLSFDLSRSLKNHDQSTFVSYIMTYNLIGVPKSNVDAFSVEISTLNSEFVEKAHEYGKKVYAWDVNTPNTVQRMRLYDVDGLITDDIPVVKKTIENTRNSMTFSQKLRIYLLDLGNADLTDLSSESFSSFNV
ncbi:MULTISPECIES: glycerophosphoryl diester phosphodiesterase membrane domain-containing protein [Lactococcus]|uniref:glycerophosphoryl diester phosphodiesterase membrane domain-containing protein n=1 Tax=Lactococcus TaxID=1357 RepID=UPI001920C798|nr:MULTISPECIES: glycerophosphodiester phosphodiesterase [Lactococcus]MBL3715244.1 glycerophosphodiester phosphodiesterase [Lactococcus garvieae]